MSDRAHLYRVITDNQGTVSSETLTVSVYSPGTTTLLADTVFADNTTSTALTNPFTVNSGIVDFYLATPQRVDLKVDNGTAFTLYRNVDVLEIAGTLIATRLTNVDLGTWTDANFHYTPVPSIRRGLIYRFTVTSTASTWSLRVSSQPGGAGEIMLEALGLAFSPYAISWPWVYENSETPPTQNMYVGVANLTAGSAHFVLTEMRAEVFGQ